MKPFVLPLQIRWADIDSNVHVRHSVYYDWAAMCRLIFLEERGLGSAMMQRLQFGPVIFREECVFRKEIKYGDLASISLKLLSGRRDLSRWTVMHEIKKNDEELCAVLTIEGAWLNVAERKLYIPPAEVTDIFRQIPMDENFQWLD